MKGFIRTKKRIGKKGQSISFAWVENKRLSGNKVKQKLIAYLGTIQVIGGEVSKKSQERFARTVSSLAQRGFSQEEYFQIHDKIDKIIKKLGLKIHY